MKRLGMALLCGSLLVACGSPPLHQAYLAQRERDQAAAQALLAQAPADDAARALWVSGQRQRLEQERADIERDFAQTEQRCWQRFAVNDCLSQARQQRRLGLDALREQELALNAMEREREAQARLHRLKDKQP